LQGRDITRYCIENQCVL